MKKILIVDDLEEIRELLETTFKFAGFQKLLLAKDGKKAIDIAKKEKPDLILMDVMMPGTIDGIEATRILKKDPETKKSIIVILTAKCQKNDSERGYASGADYFFFKPFSPQDLIKKVDKMIGI
ncbi:MAG: response regulator [Candidatus Aminicenantes bacterium]|nr:response regulator [Candidatus Aminicenantes bacterium]